MKMIFMGRKKHAAELLEWSIKQGIEVVAVVTDSHFANSPTAKKALQLQIPVISMEQAEEMIADRADIDIVVSYLFWRKIKEPLISGSRLGCINFHPAPLPDWRGTAGYNIAILNKLSKWGATAHYVDSNIDTGAIIKKYQFDFDWRLETAYSLEAKTQEIQKDLYKSVLMDLKFNQKLESYEQTIDQGIYVSRNEMENMKKVDIQNDDIDLKIRAFWFPPYEGAYIEISNKKYTLINDFILKQLADKNTTSNA